MTTTPQTHGAFFTALLARLKLPADKPQLRTLAAVSIYESSEGDEKWFNPLACEQDWPGATNYNSAGVKVYPTFTAGVKATAELLAGPHWADVRAHLADDTSTRGPMLDAFTRAYTWADVDFRALAFTTADLDARLAHTLRGPS